MTSVDNWCPMCAEYEISDDYVVLKKDRIKQLIKEVEGYGAEGIFAPWILHELKDLLGKEKESVCPICDGYTGGSFVLPYCSTVCKNTAKKRKK